MSALTPGRKLRALRLKMGVSLADLARRMDMTPSEISRRELGFDVADDLWFTAAARACGADEPTSTGDALMSTMTPKRAAELIERSKDDRALIAGSEVREVARGYLDALNELAKLRAAATAAVPVQPPEGSGWGLLPDGSYSRGLEVMYFDPDFLTASGRRGLWFKKHPHEQQGRSVGGGPAQGFWGDDTEP
jgi:transcriptional regulator with XRE-family HTH domain